MTPLHIQIIMHYHTCCDDIFNVDAPATQDFCASLVRDNILYRRDAGDSNRYGITERGKALIKHILSQPLPEQVWAMPKESK